MGSPASLAARRPGPHSAVEGQPARDPVGREAMQRGGTWIGEGEQEDGEDVHLPLVQDEPGEPGAQRLQELGPVADGGLEAGVEVSGVVLEELPLRFAVVVHERPEVGELAGVTGRWHVMHEMSRFPLRIGSNERARPSSTSAGRTAGARRSGAISASKASVRSSSSRSGGGSTGGLPSQAAQTEASRTRGTRVPERALTWECGFADLTG